MPFPTLVTRGLLYRIGNRTLWHDLDLEIGAGECVAIAGASGVGKTMLLRALAGLAPVTAGAIHFRGRALDHWHMPAYRAQVVYLAQRPALPEGSVEAALRRPFHLQVHRGKRYCAATVSGYLETLGFDTEFLGRDSENLSGGEAEIAAMLRALLIEPVILLLDEPTASLDEETTRRMEGLIGTWLQGDDRRACVWTSHDRAQLERVSRRIIALQNGP